MKTLKLGIITLSLGLLAFPSVSAHAMVVKNPVDLTPTAMRNSGATYGPNVVTSMDGSMNTNPNSNMSSNDLNSTDVNSRNDPSATMTYNDLNTDSAIVTDPATGNDDIADTRITTTRSSAHRTSNDLVDTDKAVATNYSADPTTMTGVRDQQAQQVEPVRSGAGVWVLSFLALIVAGGILYAVRNRENHPTFRS